jgi:hypothetical protein
VNTFAILSSGLLIGHAAAMAADKLVIGASGFLGSHVTRQLVERGESVRVMMRETSSTRAIAGFPVQRHYGDIFDDHALRTAMSGCDVVYYCVVAARGTGSPPRTDRWSPPRPPESCRSTWRAWPPRWSVSRTPPAHWCWPPTADASASATSMVFARPGP